jgi:VWFA-related protein
MRAALPFRVTYPLIAIAFLCWPGQVRTQNSPEQTSPTFKAETRQVLVDVVVSDHAGHFVPGLKATDFMLFEDGKPQKIAGFGAHQQPTTPAKPILPIRLPSNQYTNYQIADPQRPITIILMDVLNTQVQDRHTQKSK